RMPPAEILSGPSHLSLISPLRVHPGGKLNSGCAMSKWWILRLIWLMLGMQTGIIVLLPESAEILAGILGLSLILAMFVLLGRVTVLTLSENLKKLKSALAKRDPNKTTLARQEFFPGVAVEFEAAKVGTEQAPASDSKTELSRFKFAGFNF